MSTTFNKIYSISNSLAGLVTTEMKYNGTINPHDIVYIFRSDYFAKLLLSKVSSVSDKIKIFITTYFILNAPNFDKDTLEKIISDLYIVVIHNYEEKEDRQTDCYNCDGYGETVCEYCAGDGYDNCDECDGYKTVTCDYCDGSGKEEDEDDEGNEISISCESCDGTGEITCPTCDGNGKETCGYCGGDGENNCSNCDGSGVIGEEGERYSILATYNVVLGDKFSKYESEYFTINEFNEILKNKEITPFNIQIFSKVFPDEEDMTYQERRETVDMEDDFIEVLEVFKLENFTTQIDF